MNMPLKCYAPQKFLRKLESALEEEPNRTVLICLNEQFACLWLWKLLLVHRHRIPRKSAHQVRKESLCGTVPFRRSLSSQHRLCASFQQYRQHCQLGPPLRHIYYAMHVTVISFSDLAFRFPQNSVSFGLPACLLSTEFCPRFCPCCKNLSKCLIIG